jgi:hypothetical protein
MPGKKEPKKRTKGAGRMRALTRERLRLARRRINHRYGRARFYALVFGGLFTVWDWAGLRGGYFWGEPRSLSEIWWHFPVIAAALFLGFLLWPFHDRMDDGPRDC